MTTFRRLTCVVACCCLFAVQACSASDEEANFQLALHQTRVIAHQHEAEFQSVAIALMQSPIEWADREVVRLRSPNGESMPSNWRSSSVDQTTALLAKALFGKFDVVAIHVSKQRVSFGLAANGLAPSGTAIGILVDRNGNAGCDVVGKIEHLQFRGFQCEKINQTSYFYVQR